MANISKKEVVTFGELQTIVADVMFQKALQITIDMKPTEEVVRQMLKQRGVEADDQEVRKAILKVINFSTLQVLSTNYEMPPTNLRQDIFIARVCFQTVNKS